MPREKQRTTPVELWQDTYEALVNLANERNYSIRQFVNELLYLVVEKRKVIKKICPDVELDAVSPTSRTIYLKDLSEGKHNIKTAEITVKNDKIHCGLCNAFDCKHIHFSYCVPEVSLLIRTDGNNGNSNSNNNNSNTQKNIGDPPEEELKPKINNINKNNNNNNNNKIRAMFSNSLVGIALGGAAATSIMMFAMVKIVASITTQHSHIVLTSLFT